MKKLSLPELKWIRYYRLRVSLDERAKTIHCSSIDRFGEEHKQNYVIKSLKVTGLTRLAQTFPQRAQPKQPFKIDAEKLGIVEEFTVQCTFIG